MKLTSDQRRWFTAVQAQWLDTLRPASTPLGRHVFDVAERVPDDAVRQAQVFASRIAALDALGKGGRVAEVGTQAGVFAEQIMDRLVPEELDLFDLEFDTLRAARPGLAAESRVRLHAGDSSAELGRMPDQCFDLIYIDGDHTLEGVRRDRDVAVRKLKPAGVLVFNDYTVWSIMELSDYGTVPVVNEMLAGGGWEMLYIALHPLMYCDVAIRRRT